MVFCYSSLSQLRYSHMEVRGPQAQYGILQVGSFIGLLDTRHFQSVLFWLGSLSKGNLSLKY
jgi:hypothetical protein